MNIRTASETYTDFVHTTFRTRRKRCDAGRPQCENCLRLNLTCEWAERRDVHSEHSSKSKSPPPQLQVSHSLDFWDVFSGDLDERSEQLHLLRYYAEAYVPSVSVAASATSYYMSLYMPWAVGAPGGSSNGMLSVILAISSAQLARRVVDSQRAKHLKSVSGKYEKRSYTFLKERISPTDQLHQDRYQVIAIILILVGLEALNGKTNSRWISMLCSTRRLLDSIPVEQSIKDCVEVDSLQRHWCYHNAWA